MDFSYTAQHQRFRNELRAWLAANLPPGWGKEVHEPTDEDERAQFRLAWERKLHDGQWIGLNWPKEYGGRGATQIEQGIFAEEMARARAPEGLNIIGRNLVGPTLLRHGTEAQRKRYLPKILSSEEVWCQGFSEPNAGSDLASLRTEAVLSGDEFIVNGQKIWTSLAQWARYGILIARTDVDVPKHQGVSYFVCPMDTPGIEIRPIIEMTGTHTFNEVFLTDVRLPAENLVGEEHRGWELAKVTLGNERVSLSGGGALWGNGPSAGDLLDLVRDRGGVADPVLRQRLAALHVEAEVLRLIRLRTVTARIKGEPPGPEASIRKAMADDHGQRIMELAKDLAGSAGMLADAGPLGADAGMWTHGFLFAPALTIGGGTSVVQRNIIAERVLGLPHDVDVEQGKTWIETRRRTAS